MAIDVERLLIHLDANFTAYEKALSLTVRATNSEARKIEKRLDDMSRQNEKSLSRLSKSLIGTLATGATATMVGRFADAWTGVQNSLKTAGLSGRELTGTLDRLFDVAQDGAVEIEAVSALHGRLVQSQNELNASSADMQRFTEGVVLALKVQGASAAQASGTLVQLSQALGGGVVRAEEYNSVNEQARPILQAVANGLQEAGGSLSKLRGLVVDGKVSSEAFFRAFLAGMGGIERSAQTANETIEQGFIRVKNALTKYIGETDQAVGASRVLVAALTKLADNFETFADVSLQVASIIAGALIGRSIAGLMAKVPVAIAVVSALRVAFAAASGGAAAAAAATGSLGTVVGTVAARVPVASAAMTGLGVALNTTAGRAVAMRVALLGLGVAAGPIGLLLGGAATAAALLATNFDGATNAADAHEQALATLKDEVENAKYRSEEYRQQLIAEKKAQLEAAQAALVHAKALVAQRLEAAKALVVGTEDQPGFMPQVFDYDQNTGRQRNMTAEEYIRGGGILDKVEADATKAQERVSALEAAIAELESTSSTGKVSLRDYGVSSTAGAGRGGAARGQRERQDNFEREIEAIKKRTEALRVEAGIVGLSTYEAEKARAAHELLTAAKESGVNVNEALREKIDSLAGTYAAATVEIEKAREAQQRMEQSIREVKDLGKEVLGGFIRDLRDGKSAADALASALNKIADKLLDMALDNLFAGLFGGGNGGGGLLGNILGSIFHEGGVVGLGGTKRAVSALAFASAPRLHSGAYLKPGEMPAILQSGERVLSRADNDRFVSAINGINARMRGLERNLGTGRTGTATNAPAQPVQVVIQTQDAESFRRSRGQVEADIARAVQRGRRGL